MREGDTRLIDARGTGARPTAALLADGADGTSRRRMAAAALRCTSPARTATLRLSTLLAANADVNMTLNEGTTPMYIACQKGHTEVVTKLLAANADVNRPQRWRHAAVRRQPERRPRASGRTLA